MHIYDSFYTFKTVYTILARVLCVYCTNPENIYLKLER